MKSTQIHLESVKIDEIHRKSMKSNANQARELRSSLAPCSLPLAPCSLLGFKDPKLSCRGTTPVYPVPIPAQPRAWSRASGHRVIDYSIHRLLRGRRQRRQPSNPAAGFHKKPLGLFVKPLVWFLKNNDKGKVLLILFKGVPALPPTSQQPAAGGARKSMKKR